MSIRTATTIIESLRRRPCARRDGYPCTNKTVFGPDWRKECDCGLKEHNDKIDKAIAALSDD